MLNGDNQIKIGAVLSYLSIGLNILAGLFYTPWMIDQIGQSQYGLYTLANSLITLFVVDFGLGSATSRFLSKYRATGETEKANNFLGAVYKLFLFIDAIILVALTVAFFLIDTVYLRLTAEELEQFKVVYVIAAGFSVVSFPFLTLNGILTAHEKFVQLKLADIIHRVITIAAMGIALSAGFGLYALVVVNAAAGLLVIVYKLIVVYKTTPVKVNFLYSEPSMYKEIFGFSFWITVAGLAQRLIFNITPSILGFVASSADIAVFGIVTTIEGYAYTISSAINGMFMPRIAQMYSGDDAQGKIMPLMMSVGRFQFALNGLIVAGFAVVGKEFISLWMDDAYRDAYYGILLVIIPGLFFNSMQIANTAIIVTTHVKQYAFVHVAMGLINIVVSPILSYYFGVIGACLSIFVAYTIRAVGLNILYQKKLGIDMVFFVKQCYVRMSIPIVLTIAIGSILNFFVTEHGWLALIAKAIAITAVYAGALVAFGYKPPKR